MSGKNGDMIERKAVIFNIQKYNMHDGPGVRTLAKKQKNKSLCE